MKLNLGCGHLPLEGWVNVDLREGPGVDLAGVDLDKPGSLSMLRDESVTEVRAHALLEHLQHWENLVVEVARVLRPGGTFDIRVPFGWDYSPFHVRAFGPRSMNIFCKNVRYLSSDFRFNWTPGSSSLEFDGMQFYVLEDKWVEYLYPFSWHLAQRIGPAAYRLPIGRKASWNWRLRRA